MKQTVGSDARQNTHIALFLPTLEGGGAERSFVELANRFVQSGARVDFVLADCDGPYLAELSNAVRVVDFKTRRKIPTLIGLTRYLRAERPDILMSGLDPANAGAVIATKLAGVSTRCVLSQQSMMRALWQMDRPSSWSMWLWIMRQTYSRASLVICNSFAARSELTQEVGVAPARCIAIHNGIEIEQIQGLAREEIVDPWLADAAPPFIISVGRLTPMKDLSTVMQAFVLVRRSRECNLLILGDGIERSRLSALAASEGVAPYVRMPGFTANPFPWMARARVLVSASLIEGCPNVVQQALACGTPVVAADGLGGTAEVLENGRWGRLVPVKNPRAMAQAIIDSLDDPHPVDGRIRAADFNPERTAERYMECMCAVQ
jgi:glycosyltransferase involved in cell wall biosynthesis